MDKTTIQRAKFEKGRRILMMSDIHGHADEMTEALEAAKFSKDDILVIVGDLLEKGLQSLKALRLAMALTQTHTVYTLMGNVDAWRYRALMSDDPQIQADFLRFALSAREQWGSTVFHEMCAEAQIEASPSMDLPAALTLLRRAFKPELSFLGGLPTILDTEYMTFVHGGIPHENLDALLHTPRCELLKCDDFVSRGLSFSKYVVVGHWPVQLYCQDYPCAAPLVLKDRRILSIDGGCGVKREGQLNLVIINSAESEEFAYIAVDRLPAVIALEDQAPSQSSTYIKWTDGALAVLSQDDFVTRVASGERELTVPNELIYHVDGEVRCDASDYLLPVKKGDRLKLVGVYGDACYMKKDSVTGRYQGKYQAE